MCALRRAAMPEEAAVLLRHTVAFVVFLSFMVVLLFWPAGTFDWPGAWIFIAEMGIAGMAISLWLLTRSGVRAACSDQVKVTEKGESW